MFKNQEQNKEQNKEYFSSRIAFLLALIGSAVGLGNIWRVSYLFSYFGSDFLVSYLIFAFVIGLPLVFLELKLSEKYRLNVKGLYSLLSEKLKIPFFKHLYLIPFLALFIISIYYSIVVSEVFNNIVHISFFSVLLVWLISLYAVIKGIRSLETVNNFLMTLLFFMLLFLLLTIEKIPNLLNFPSNNFFEAIKQGFAHTMFSLSVGTGLLYTYAIYSRKQKAFQNSLIVAFFDTLIALISLLVIFSIDVKPDVFLAFENIKKKFIEIDKPLLSYIFFIALFSAGLTSLIAILKFLLDNSDEKILFLAFLLSFFAYFLPKPIIEFADSVIATTLLILSFPLTIFTFSYLIFKK